MSLCALQQKIQTIQIILADCCPFLLKNWGNLKEILRELSSVLVASQPTSKLHTSMPELFSGDLVYSQTQIAKLKEGQQWRPLCSRNDPWPRGAHQAISVHRSGLDTSLSCLTAAHAGQSSHFLCLTLIYGLTMRADGRAATDWQIISCGSSTIIIPTQVWTEKCQHLWLPVMFLVARMQTQIVW